MAITTLNELTAKDVLNAWEAWQETLADPYLSELRAAIEHLERAHKLRLVSIPGADRDDNQSAPQSQGEVKWQT